MTKEHSSGSNEQPAGTPSLFSAAVSKFSRMGSNRNLSPSASKYRVSSFLAATGVSVTPANAPPQPQAGTPASPSAKKLHELVRQSSVRGSRHSLKLSDAVVSEASDVPGRESSGNGSPTRGKLPQKIRASVTRMRSQLTLTTNNSESPTKTRQRHSSAFGLVSGTASSTATANRRRVSRQLQETESQQHRMSQELASPASPAKQTTAVRLPANNSDPAFVLRFMELLRPLQSSMSSLRDAGGINDQEDESDDDEEQADAIFRQHERESSRILRICCSLDNLLFAIADQVQEHNDDLLAIARGPAHELVQLILSGIRQIVAAMATTQPSGEQAGSGGLPSLTAKEERYLREFLVEISDRWSELDELLRGVFLANLETVQKEYSDLQELYAELKTEKQALELEMIDIREFNSNQSSASVAVASNFMRLANQSDNQQRPESNDRDERNEDEHLAGYELKENQGKDGEQRTAAEEVEVLKKQCEEYGRLLEMAKQEIRLCHQERQSQHARLMELSQTLLKDEEVAQLRNELQSEKKRVKRLEIESLGLRETQMDLNMKIQSLQLNQPGKSGTGPASSKPSANLRGIPSDTAHLRPRSGSAALTPDDLPSATSEVDAQPGVTSNTDGKIYDEAESTENEANGSTALTLHPNPQSDVKIPWISRWVVLGTTTTGENEDDGLVRRFFADLLMTDKEFEAALAQSKLRKRASVPSTGAPPPSTGAGQSLPSVKKKKTKQPATQDPNAVAIPTDEWVEDAITVSSVRQLIWVFYELYLMAEEARRIDPQLTGRAKWHRAAAPPLASFVLHYFLERHVSESEAVHNLRRFVFVLSKLRQEYGDIHLFCEFLDGHRSREELNFFLWTLQAIESVDLGVNYDQELSTTASNARLGRYVCTLKALYVSRMVYHFLHVKSLKKPAPSTPATAAKRKPSIQPVIEPRGTPNSPSKKRRKSRPNSASAMATIASSGAQALAETVASPDPNQAKPTVVETARQLYADALTANSGYPLTLEAFNNVVLSFAETPSREELVDRLGVFYQPTGDERKVSLDTFLVLLMELFSTQLYWRKTQLHALFVRLAKEEELAALLAAKKRQEEAETAAAQGKKGRVPPPEKKEKKKLKLSPSKKRQRRVGIDGSTDKYLRGLNRERFRDFLVQGGLVVDVPEYDMDSLYVAILETTNRTPSEIHFDDLYVALTKFEMLGNDSYAVDFSAWEASDRVASQDSQADLRGVVLDEWRQLSRFAIVMTENDPNVYTRRSARQLLRCLSASKVHSTELETIKHMRSFLALAWRVACHRLSVRTNRRDQFQWCLTEFFHFNQAIRTICSAENHYTCTTDLERTTKACTQFQDDLSLFYDAEIISHVLGMPTGAMDDQMTALVSVLQRYSLHIAHLFDTYGSARYTTSEIGLTKDQWVAMAHDLGLVYDHGLSLPVCEAMFVTIASASPAPVETKSSEEHTVAAAPRSAMRGGEALELDKPRFVALLLHTAVKRQEVMKHTQKARDGARAPKKQDSPLTLLQVVEIFFREIITPKAFAHPSNMVEDDFHRKLANPLVARALLEHRAFLRHIFFQHAKHDADEGNVDEPAHLVGVRQGKSKHNSMVLAQFTAFLLAFGLLESTVPSVVPTTPTSGFSPQASGVVRLDEAGARYLFRAVMAVESDDHTHMEFDEFAAAIAALAAWRDPHPFLLWHVKIDAFVQELRRRAARGHRGDDASF